MRMRGRAVVSTWVKRARTNDGDAVTRCGELRFFADVEMCPSRENREPAGNGVRNEKEKVPPAGFEPATDGLENRCSIRLSYGGDVNCIL